MVKPVDLCNTQDVPYFRGLNKPKIAKTPGELKDIAIIIQLIDQDKNHKK
jgi:hypothetical protein